MRIYYQASNMRRANNRSAIYFLTSTFPNLTVQIWSSVSHVQQYAPSLWVNLHGDIEKSPS